jgi:hypothetical protein
MVTRHPIKFPPEPPDRPLEFLARHIASLEYEFDRGSGEGWIICPLCGECNLIPIVCDYQAPEYDINVGEGFICGINLMKATEVETCSHVARIYQNFDDYKTSDELADLDGLVSAFEEQLIRDGYLEPQEDY